MPSTASAMLPLLLLLLIQTSAAADASPYKGDQIVAVKPVSDEQSAWLRVWRVTGLMGDSSKQLDFWSTPGRIGEEVTLRVPSELLRETREKAKELGMKWRVVNEDVAGLISAELEANSRATGDHKRFLRMDEIDSFVDRLVAGCSVCSVEVIGRSAEGRDIRVVKVGNSPSLPTVFLEGGAHAREWISPAALLYILDKVINDPAYSRLLNSWNLAVAVVINPDGYEYTHTGYRLWRKNRRQFGSCYGVDLNRNFGYKWGGAGTSSWQCSDLYRGESAFSESETASVRDFVQRNLASLRAYWSVHSYGQYWLHPWGYQRGLNPSNVEELKAAGNAGAAALRAVNGRSYRVGHSADLLYAAAGGSDDFAFSLGVPFAYTLELPDTGRYGFVLPPEMIESIGAETLAALDGFLAHIGNGKAAN